MLLYQPMYDNLFLGQGFLLLSAFPVSNATAKNRKQLTCHVLITVRLVIYKMDF